MKKTILLSVFVLTMISINAQSYLFKGFISGMSKSAVDSYCQSHTDFEYNKITKAYETVIEGRKYSIRGMFNNQDELKSLLLVCREGYEWMYFDPDTKANISELYNLLDTRYGDPVSGNAPDWTDIPKGKSYPVAVFEDNTISAYITVTERSGKYYVSVGIVDTKFTEPITKDSGGF